MKLKKVSVHESWYIFAIVMLAILLVLSLYLFLQNPFVTNQPKYLGLVPIGTPLNIKVNSTGSSVRDVFFHGSVLPNSRIPQEVRITLKPAQENCVVRAKAVMINEFGKVLPLSLTTASNWRTEEDDYYYCQEVLSANLVLEFVKDVQIPDAETRLNSANTYSIIFIVETLPQAVNFKEIWKIN